LQKVIHRQLHPESVIAEHFRGKDHVGDGNRGERCVATFITGKSSDRSEVWPLISTCPDMSMRPYSVHLLVLLHFSLSLPPLSLFLLSPSLYLFPFPSLVLFTLPFTQCGSRWSSAAKISLLK